MGWDGTGRKLTKRRCDLFDHNLIKCGSCDSKASRDFGVHLHAPWIAPHENASAISASLILLRLHSPSGPLTIPTAHVIMFLIHAALFVIISLLSPSATCQKGAVTSEVDECSKIGIRLLENGGNSADAVSLLRPRIWQFRLNLR